MAAFTIACTDTGTNTGGADEGKPIAYRFADWKVRSDTDGDIYDGGGCYSHDITHSWHAREERFKINFYTGGNSSGSATKLFAIFGTATKLESPNSPGSRLLSPEEITIGGFGTPDSYGYVYATLAADQTVDVTPKARVDYYTGGAGGTEVKVRIFDANTGAELTDKTTTVVVGQQINLYCTVSVPAPVQPTNYQWNVPGFAISNYIASVNSGTVYSNFATILTNVVFYWVDGATNRAVTCSATVHGQKVVGEAKFTIKRPNVQMTTQAPGAIAADANYIYNIRAGTSYTFLHFGGATSGTSFTPGIKFELLSTDIEGPLFFIQTGHSRESDMATNGITYVGIGDGVDNGVDPNDYIYPLDGSFPGFVADDSPATSLSSSFTNVNRSDSYTTHLMFQATNAAAIAVPIKKVDWSWSATAVLTSAASNVWNVISATPPLNPVPLNSTSYPTWTNHMQPIKWTPPL